MTFTALKIVAAGRDVELRKIWKPWLIVVALSVTVQGDTDVDFIADLQSERTMNTKDLLCSVCADGGISEPIQPSNDPGRNTRDRKGAGSRCVARKIASIRDDREMYEVSIQARERLHGEQLLGL
jgi:hypothetical protein